MVTNLLPHQQPRPASRQPASNSSGSQAALQRPQTARSSQRPMPTTPSAGAVAAAAGPPAFTRRRTLTLLPPLALIAAAWSARPAWADDEVDDEGGSDSAASFYSKWPYVQPADILPFLRGTARRGDPDSVLAAIDTFAAYYPMYRSGPEKGRVLEEVVGREAPSLALELGTFMGYGTIRIARAMPPGGRVISIEADEQQAAVAREVLALSGLDDPSRVQVLTGLSSNVLPRLAEALPPAPGRRAGLVFLDHCKPCYLPDIQAMEVLGLVGPGSVVIADNVVYPGTPEYLAHVQAPGYTAAEPGPGAAGGPSRGASKPDQGRTRVARAQAQARFLYDTQLIDAAFEVEQRFKEGWEPQRDALAVSRCLGEAPE